LSSLGFSRRWPWVAACAFSLGVAAIGAVGLGPGCSIYGPDLLLPAPDAGPDAVSDAAPDAAVACAHVRWPNRPATANASANFSVIAAMQAIDVGYGFGTGSAVDAGDAGPTFGSDGGLPPFGWDLDNDCTCQGSPPGPPSCLQAAGTKENCDDFAGRDHIALELFEALSITAETGSQTANQAMQAGQYGLVVQITGYNGMSNDEEVTVALYASNGIDGVQDGGTPVAQHNGNDKWTVDPRYITEGAQLVGTDCETSSLCQPTSVDDTAYVAGGILVAQFPNSVPLTFGSRANIGGALMQLNGVVLVGTLVAAPIAGSGEGWAIVNGSISGRWETSQLLGNLSTIPDPMSPDPGYFCGSDPFYATFKNVICSLQDIEANGLDNQTPLAPCDALSMAFAFTAEPARLGPVYGVAAAPAGCIDDAGLAWHDTCQ
jgi:hypothetical protein